MGTEIKPMTFGVAAAYFITGVVILTGMLIWDANGAPTAAHFVTAFSGYPIGQGIVGMWRSRRTR
ncbi:MULTISPECIES: hypothetical protein [unclassified Microbacterium]|uniref:hypothetical protein n=1 Tax=unclassified Microbacterium TaxID=2609290 RepID=UPI000D57BD4B|nr:hypothetical protein [Microbacterium sp. Gd 4-13]PVW03991.1 hypothetical protein DEA06_11545 [Microbacterium sp. Gd 4-13]